jgi:uncharacterized membrane protein YfhO
MRAGRRSFARIRRWYPIPLAALSAAAVFVASGIIRGTYPFGDKARNTNDLGQQFIPMHAHLRDILTGQASGDLIFNWSSGFGVPFLGDFMAYVGTSLSWIVLLFPRNRIDLSLFVIATAAMALGAGAMTAYLRLLRPTGPAWLAALAGVSYALCGWAIDDAAYMTEWLNGMVAFGVICLLCEWILRRRSITSLLVSPFVVTLLWISHFYTVYMATLGAAIVVLARVLSYDAAVSWRHRISGALRCLVAVAAGIGMSAPLLVPIFRAVRSATPSPKEDFKPISWLDFLSRLLAGSEGVGTTPGLAVGTLMLLLALSFPFNRAIAARERIVWTVTVVLTVVSMQITFTHEVWHGFDSPNGSPFRQAFVIAGMLVIVGWMSVTSGVRNVVAVAIPLVLLAVLYVAAYDVRTVTATTHIVVPIVAAVLLVWLLARWRPGASQWVGRGAAALLIGAVLVEATASTVAIDQARAKFMHAYPAWGDRQDEARSLMLSALDWPRQRVAPGETTTVNDPMLIGGQGPEYYSSTIPYDLSKELIGLGFGYSSYGRATYDPENPVVDAVFSIGARVVSEGDPATGPLRLAKYAPGPLVSVRPSKTWTSRDPGAFGRQETALGADVYIVPKVKPVASPGVNVSDRRAGEFMVLPKPGAAMPAEVRLTASCKPGSEIYLSAPSFVGDVLIHGDDWEAVLKPNAKRPGVYTGAPMKRVGTVGANGVVDVRLRVAGRARMPSSAIGCLDRNLLNAAVARLNQAQPAAVDVGGHSIDVRLAPGEAGTVVIGVVRIPGWQCAVDGGPGQKPNVLAGLLAVRVDGKATEVSCTYRPPGARMGLAVGAAALLGLVVVAVALALLRRRRTLAESH